MKSFFPIARLGLAAVLSLSTVAQAAPKVILISLDGATKPVVDSYFSSGVLDQNVGLGVLRSHGTAARRNITVVPSLTAPSHIAIATGSIASQNDINANSFHLVNSNFTTNISGFGAPIGGYTLGNPPAPATTPTAEPLWVQLRKHGKTVATATWPGGDGVDVKEPSSGVIVQPAIPTRTVDYTVPFGSFGGIGAKGYDLVGGFATAPQTTVDQLTAAGKASFSPIQQTIAPLDTFSVSGGPTYVIQVAALDTSNDSTVNYDTLVFFDTANGIQPGPFSLPATGPAYVKLNTSDQFYLEGSPNKAGLAFYVTLLNADLSQVRVAHSSANNIPRNPTVLATVDDVNNNVGFWAPQPDFRIPERISPGFTTFPDAELEVIYQDQVRTFVQYQTQVGLRAIAQNPNADLVMIYIEQPDGSGHQFTLTDPRQAT
ncbi:alkaline phosphatase family protein [Candidatus Cyanaurora vandensis]|nr:alkaline phosphatase family protein [Candidatus Cyanaurora vandensis]